jgi:uncharacterized protein YciI
VYLMISKYLVPLDEIDKLRSDHLAFLDGLHERGVLVTAGRQDPPAGGVVLLDVQDEAAARELMSTDPYVTSGTAEYTAIGWRPTIGALAGYGKA